MRADPADAGSPAHDVSALEIVAILLAGVAAGTINTVVGSGTLITFPTLLAFGVPPVTANVSNTVGLVPGSLSGAVGYRAELSGQRTRLLRLGSASLLGGTAGAVLLLWLPSEAFDAIVPVLVGLGVLLVVIGRGISRRVAAAAEASGRTARARRLVGVAGGARWPVSTAATSAQPRGCCSSRSWGSAWPTRLQRYNATKNVLALIVNGVAAIVFIAVADVDWEVAGLIAVGSIVGGQLGATVGRRLPPAVLRAVIVVVGVTALVVFLRD